MTYRYHACTNWCSLGSHQRSGTTFRPTQTNGNRGVNPPGFGSTELNWAGVTRELRNAFCTRPPHCHTHTSKAACSADSTLCFIVYEKHVSISSSLSLSPGMKREETTETQHLLTNGTYSTLWPQPHSCVIFVRRGRCEYANSVTE